MCIATCLERQCAPRARSRWPEQGLLITIALCFALCCICQEATYSARNQKLYNVTFKSHHFWHMAFMARWVNPRSGWCYAEERFVGMLARVVKSVVCGGGVLALGKTLPVKWCELMKHRQRRLKHVTFA